MRWDSQRSVPGRGNSIPNPAGLGVGKNLVRVTYWREDNVARAEGGRRGGNKGSGWEARSSPAWTASKDWILFY